MKSKILKLCFLLIGILFVINCQKDYSEDKNIRSEQTDETNINAQGQSLERIILPFEEPDAGLPACYMSEIKDGKEILTPMKQLPPSIPGGNGSDGVWFPPPEVYNATLYFVVGEIQERLAPTNISTGGTGIGIWDYVNVYASDFDYLITNNGNKIKLTAKKATTNESNKIACGTYEVYSVTPGYQHPYIFDPGIDNDDDSYTVYILRMVQNYTLITYPYTFVID
ncbi:MAG: hypothetical protein LBP85_09730 [Prevotellaceae bacterium]|jgi:hypothetical protein|nr:hypothetical protein [Prevotellaceae bacterium]